jgi:hypothetical protein
MMKHLDDLDKKNKNLSNLALLPGFYISDNVSNNSKSNNELINIYTRIENDKDVIEEKMFLNFFSSIDHSNKKQSKKKRKNQKKKDTKKR